LTVCGGVKMLSADGNDIETLRVATEGCYASFGVRNYWDKDVLDKAKEQRQGLNIFEASRANGVTHLVWSALPYVSRLNDGKLSKINHFDSKAFVAEEIEIHKGEMICSYLPPGELSMIPDYFPKVDVKGQECTRKLVARSCGSMTANSAYNSFSRG
ncbi:hypothetical protein LTR95_019643, partial [Oleoguttula sp. CCFEE 5521]